MLSKIKTAPPKNSKPASLQFLWPACLAFGAYVNSLSNGFVGDDKEQLLQNPAVSGHQFGAFFTAGVWAFRGVRSNYYRPLQFTVYALLHSLFGVEAFRFHLAMVLLHVLNTSLVYWLTLRIVSRARVALAAAALFALHPIHTETVDWIASLPDLMMTAFVVLALWRFVREDAAPRPRQIPLHCAMYLGALLSKETGVVLLPLYLGFELIQLRRPLRELGKNAVLYGSLLATGGAYLAMRWVALGGLAPGQETFHRLGPAEFFLSGIVAAGHYAGSLILPFDLNYFHVFHATRTVTLPFLLALAAIVTLGAVAFRSQTSSAVRYGLFWIAVTLAPALNLTGVGQNVFAERYLYLPSVGLAWMAGLAFDWMAARQPRVAWTAAAAILCAATWQTVSRNGDWRDDFTLLRKTVAQSPEAGIMHNNLAGAYVERNDLDHALEQERLAVQFEPRSAPFHKNLGLLLMVRDPRSAIAEFEEAQRLQPSASDLPALLKAARSATGRQ